MKRIIRAVFFRCSNGLRKLYKSNLLLRKYLTYWFLISKGVETKLGYVKLYGKPLIRKTSGSRIIIGEGTTIVSNSQNNIAGINHKTIIATLSNTAIIQIGRAGISGATICAAKGIYIGDYTGIGANSKLYDTDFHVINPAKRRNQSSILDAKADVINIENDVWISADVTVLKGVTIGEGAVIGAASVVTKNIPKLTLAAGNPAKIIRQISENE